MAAMGQAAAELPPAAMATPIWHSLHPAQHCPRIVTRTAQIQQHAMAIIMAAMDRGAAGSLCVATATRTLRLLHRVLHRRRIATPVEVTHRHATATIEAIMGQGAVGYLHVVIITRIHNLLLLAHYHQNNVTQAVTPRYAMVAIMALTVSAAVISQRAVTAISILWPANNATT